MLGFGQVLSARCAFEACVRLNPTYSNYVSRLYSYNSGYESTNPWPTQQVEHGESVAGLWDQRLYSHFCDARESPPLHWGLVFGKPFFQGLIPHSFQPSLFSITRRFPWVSRGFLERFGSLERMDMEGTLRLFCTEVEFSTFELKCVILI